MNLISFNKSHSVKLSAKEQNIGIIIKIKVPIKAGRTKYTPQKPFLEKFFMLLLYYES